MRKYTISQIDLMTDLICLQKGIIHYSIYLSEERGSIDAALSSLTEDAARIAKRKFRKIVRTKTKSSKRSPSAKRSSVMEYMRSAAWEFVQNKQQDNDEG